jgi:putrescine transport system ATP-binding protein
MDLQAKLGLTFIIVTHDQEEAMKVADRIGVMNHGQLIQVAPPEEIYEKPNSRWVADFIGDVNLIEGKVATIDAGCVMVETSGGVRLRAGSANGAKTGAAVCIAVRPEKITIAAADGASPDALHGEVIEIGYRGDTSVYRVRLDNGFVLKASAANTRRSTGHAVGWNDRVALSWSPESAMVLTR